MAITDNLVVALPLQDTQPLTVLVDAIDTGNNLTPWTKPAASAEDLSFGINRADGSQPHQGISLAMWGKWDRAISGSEITNLYNSGAGRLWSAISGGSLNDAKAYWDMNEAGGSGSLADDSGRGNTLTVQGAMTSGAGPGGGGAGAIFASTTNYAWIASNADVRLPANNGSFSVFGWWKLTSLTGDAGGNLQAIVSKWPDGSSSTKSPEYGLYLNRHGSDGAALFQADLGSGVTDTPTYSNNTATSGAAHPAAATWYFGGMVYDSAANEVRLYLDGSLDGTNPVITNPDMVTAFTGLSAKFSNDVWNGTTSSGYDASGPRYASCASNADTGIGNTDGTVSFWFKRTRNGAFTEQVMIKGVTANVFDWDVRFSSDTLYFEISDGGGANFRFAGWGSTITDTNWHHAAGWHDAGVTYISVDNGTPVTGTSTGGFTPATNAHSFKVGNDGTANQFLGEVRSLYKWTRVLTSDERTFLYNAGTPVDYPFGAGSILPLVAGPMVGNMSVMNGGMRG